MNNEHKNRIYIGVIIFALMLIGLAVGLYLVQQQQSTEQEAAEPATDLEIATPSATVIPTPACFANTASCEWDPLDGAGSYNYKITLASNSAVIDQGTVESGVTNVEFEISKGVTYKCEISAVNSCGPGAPATATQACIEATPIPTTRPSATPTDTPSPTDEPTPTERPTATPTRVPSATPVPPTKVPPTAIPPTSVPQQVIKPTSPPRQVAVVTPQPTIEPAGTTEVVIGAIGGLVAIIVGAFLFFSL